MYLQSDYHSLLIRSENPLPTHPRFPAPKGFVHELGPQKKKTPPMLIPDKQAASIKNEWWDEAAHQLTHRPTAWALFFFPVIIPWGKWLTFLPLAAYDFYPYVCTCTRYIPFLPPGIIHELITLGSIVYHQVQGTNLGVTEFLITSYIRIHTELYTYPYLYGIQLIIHM